MPERFACMNVAEMHLNCRQLHAYNCIAQCVGVVGKSAWIDDDPIGPTTCVMDEIDEPALMVALKCAQFVSNIKLLAKLGLDLGHTFGHAIELVSEFDVGHGEGVALGLVASAQMAADLGRCTPELAGRIEALVDRLGLPTSVNDGYEVDAVMAAMSHDKKRSGKTLRFVIPQALGDVIVIDNPGDEYVRSALEKVLR